jgi:hypothetical protein
MTEDATVDRAASGRRTVIAAVGAGIVVVGVLVAIVVFGFVSPPTFPRLADEPNPAIPGRVAFLRYEEDFSRACIHVVDASGGAERSLGCDLFVHDLAWSVDGHLLALVGFPEAAVLDPETGQVRRFFEDEAAFDAYHRTRRFQHSDAGRLLTRQEFDGRATVSVLAPGGVPVEIASVTGPRGYSFHAAVWSPDGRWALVMDSSARLLVVAADGSQGPYLLAERADSPAWYVPGRSEYTVDIGEGG